mgnify:CR=1 FL=1
MADGKYKPCSFYVPERDTELIRFMAAQSNMSLSMRLLMKAFLASNRHETDIDVSLMDLGDLIRSMRVDPDLFEDVPRRIRPVRSISAIEAEQARAAEQAALDRQAVQPPAPSRVERSVPGFDQRVPGSGQYAPGTYAGHEPASVPEPDTVARTGMAQFDAESIRPAPVPMPSVQAPPAQRDIPEPGFEDFDRSASPAPAANGVPDDDLDPMSMMGGM